MAGTANGIGNGNGAWRQEARVHGCGAGAIILVMPARQLQSVFNIYIQQRPTRHASSSEKGRREAELGKGCEYRHLPCRLQLKLCTNCRSASVNCQRNDAAHNFWVGGLLSRLNVSLLKYGVGRRG